MLNQPKDTCLKVYNKECSFALSEMFSVELKFKDLLNKFEQAKDLATYHENFLRMTNCV